MAAKMTQTELGDAVGVKQALISMIENGETGSSSAVMPIVRLLKIPPPKQYFSDAEEERWVEAGRVLRRINEPAFRGLLTAAEQMIANAEPKEH